MSRAAREVSLRADQLIHDVERCLQRGVPEVWEDPDVARMTAENVTEHVLATLAGLVHGIEPDQIETPAADPDRARRLARHGTPVSVILRSFRLGQGVMLDRLLVEMPRLTDDAELISAATQKLIATMAGYVDRMSEQGVTVYQRERDRRLQWSRRCRSWRPAPVRRTRGMVRPCARRPVRFPAVSLRTVVGPCPWKPRTGTGSVPTLAAPAVVVPSPLRHIPPGESQLLQMSSHRRRWDHAAAAGWHGREQHVEVLVMSGDSRATSSSRIS
ncbi:hypothetical protein ACH47Z_43775 [Streptomyces sp. NPDC020192]|uniref:hypothetical protein n=1 Tax=Streptomyces sp. NPDC020192 TaxID=3365066 RepID=UPI0037BC9953